MKLCIVTAFICKFGFEKSLAVARDLGVTCVECGAVGIASKMHCDVDKLMADESELARWRETYAKYGLEIEAFAGHGAPLTPNRDIADEYKRAFRLVCELAAKVGVRKMTLVAGLPEGAEGDSCPVWVTQQTDVPFYRDVLEWQWDKRLIPYWKEQGKIAADHGVTLCFEMQVGDMLHNPVKMKRFAEQIGPVAACNFDISHMWAQGMDPVSALRYLGPLVQHTHLKDTLIHHDNLRLQGFNDTTPPALHPEQRSWTFTIPGWGHDERTWREVMATLRLIGFDGALSLEMESEYIEIEEGLRMSAGFIKSMLLERSVDVRWWEAAGFGELWKERTKAL